jgi:hypothetical protein
MKSPAAGNQTMLALAGRGGGGSGRMTSPAPWSALTLPACRPGTAALAAARR